MAVCPFISICKNKVGYEHYINFCANIREDKYKECQHYQTLSQEKKSPVEWRSVITGVTPRT